MDIKDEQKKSCKNNYLTKDILGRIQKRIEREANRKRGTNSERIKVLLERKNPSEIIFQEDLLKKK